MGYLLIVIAAYLIYNIFLAIGIWSDIKEQKILNKFYWLIIVLALGRIGVSYYLKVNKFNANETLVSNFGNDVSEAGRSFQINALSNKNKGLTIFLILFNAAWIGFIVFWIIYFLITER